MLEVLDPEQNKNFRDNYVELPYDLSEVMFIATANTLDTVPRPLLDRMEVIEMKTYTRAEKLAIAKNHMLAKQTKRCGLNRRIVKFTDEALLAIIDRYTREEYAALLERWDEREIARARELFPFTVLHLCAWRGVPNRMDVWRRHSCEIVNWAGHIELDLGLHQGRRFFNARSALMGGFDNRPCGILHWGGEAQVKAYTRQLLENAGTSRLILSADCSVQGDTPAEHLRWVAEASQAFMDEMRG